MQLGISKLNYKTLTEKQLGEHMEANSRHLGIRKSTNRLSAQFQSNLCLTEPFVFKESLATEIVYFHQ